MTKYKRLSSKTKRDELEMLKISILFLFMLQLLNPMVKSEVLSNLFLLCLSKIGITCGNILTLDSGMILNV